MGETEVNDNGRILDPDCTSDQRTYATFMHMSLLGHLILPGVAVIVPLIMWMTKKDESPFIDDHGREALNFHITLIGYSLLLPILAIPVGLLLCGVGILVTLPAALALPYVLGLVGMIMAAMAANRGEYFRYPMTMRFVH